MSHSVRYRSDALAAIHEGAQALYCMGAIDKAAMRQYDEMCLLQGEEVAATEDTVMVQPDS
jgi:putative transcriptional regulator